MITPLILGLIVTAGNQDSVLPHNTFDRGTEGWTAMQIQGEGAKVEAIYDKALLKSSPGTLAFGYKIGMGQVSFAGLTVGAGKLAKMNSIHFWLRSDHGTSVVVMLSEKDGGRYSAICHVVKNQWQEVQFAMSDFLIATEADAPKDPDGKLDPDQVETIAVIDAESYMAQNQQFSEILGVTMGPRKIYVSDFEFSPTKVKDGFTEDSSTFRADNYSRPQVGWMGFGVGPMEVVTDSPFPGKWLKVDYHTSPGHINGVVHPIKVGALAGKKNIIFEVGSTKPCQLIVQLEQVNGAKFKALVDVPGMAKSKTLVIPMSSLTIADDSPDKNAVLDLAQVKQMIVIDITGMIGSTDGDNTLYVGGITAKN